MKICICRNISDKDYPDKKKLYKRLCRKDLQCGTCVKNFAKTHKYIIKA